MARRCTATLSRALLRGAAALATALAIRLLVLGLAAAAAGLLAAAVDRVDGRPRAALGLAGADSAFLVALGDVLGLALLLVGVFRLVSSGHAGRRSKPRTTSGARDGSDLSVRSARGPSSC